MVGDMNHAGVLLRGVNRAVARRSRCLSSVAFRPTTRRVSAMLSGHNGDVRRGKLQGIAEKFNQCSVSRAFDRTRRQAHHYCVPSSAGKFIPRRARDNSHAEPDTVLITGGHNGQVSRHSSP